VSTRAIVICPLLRAARRTAREPDAVVEEAIGLARAISLDVVGAERVNVAEPRPSTLLGSGAVARLSNLIKEQEAALVIVDAALSPVQQRNLEKAWGCKVIDRTGLILEIFGERARTAEGQLQVELAALSYQRSRLVRSWTHLERQRGGFGFLGGPGESQLEIDRRLIDDRIAKIKKGLESVTRTRALHRRARQRVPYPIVALVGYTNAGKSTLFNYLTQSDVLAKDILFATLDPTMRALRLPSGRQAILSDTVGFVSELPTDLVAAFRATLEEVKEADLILHVRDMAHTDSAAQRDDVNVILRDLGLGPLVDADAPVIEVLNKIDRLDPAARAALMAQVERAPRSAAVSALTGDGVPALLSAIDRHLAAARTIIIAKVAQAEAARIAWLYQHGEVLERRDDEHYSYLRVRLDPADAAKFEGRASRRKSARAK
jgi:GTP-binding protein HflX